MKLKVISDGTLNGTKVVDLETNENLNGVYEVTWQHGVGELPKATIRLYNIPVEIECGDVKKYELRG